MIRLFFNIHGRQHRADMHIDWSVSEYFFQDIRQDKPKWRLCIECNLFFHVAERFLSVIAIKLRNALASDAKKLRLHFSFKCQQSTFQSLGLASQSAMMEVIP